MTSSTQPIRQMAQLTTREVPKEEWKTIHQIVKEWLKLATQRHFDAESNATTSLHPNKAEVLKLSASEMVISSINTCLSPEEIDDPEWDTIIVCEDSKSNVQGVALFLRGCCTLSDLATHPNNIITSYTDSKATSVRGVGSQLILDLAKRALKSGGTIQLKSTRDAEKFYEKLGFVNTSPSDPGRFYLAAARIKNLIEEKRPPFDQLQIEGGAVI